MYYSIYCSSGKNYNDISSALNQKMAIRRWIILSNCTRNFCKNTIIIV